MRHKYKLSFSIFIISSCFAQIASAGESKNEALKKITSMAMGGTVPKGFALVTNTVPFSNNITIEDGGVEIVENGKTSMGATIQKDGIQLVTRAGTAMDTKVSGGKQLIFEEQSLYLASVDKPSSAYNATISGGDGGVGQQNIYDGGKSWYTKVMGEGEQNLYMGPKKEGGIAEGTIVSGKGRQYVLEEGLATKTTLGDNATQVVYPGGIVDGLTINDFARSWLYVGAELKGEIKVNGKGQLYLYAGDVKNYITKEKISIMQRNNEVLFLVGERNNKHKPQIYMESLGGNGGTINFSFVPYDPHHISLYVEYLSGTLHFNFNISTKDGNSNYLSIGNNSTGNHTISIADSGAEITNSSSQNNKILTEFNLITDRSQGEGASFTLVDSFGKEIQALDGGTYMYTLQQRKRCADFSGDSTIWYLGMITERAVHSNNYSQCVKKKSKFPMSSFISSTDMGTRSQQESSSRRKNFSSKKSANKQEPKQRPPRHLREAQHSSDEQQQSVVSTDGQSLADQMILRPSDQDQSSPQSSQKLSVSHFLTTPSTDAVLSMSVTPALVFHNELQAVRAGRGVLDRGKKNTAFWVHAIKSKEHIVADHKDFKLDQTGIVLGVSGVSELMGGEFYIGGFGSYDQARIAHARGGVSGINTYSIGAYATYFDKSGWYLDSILKYNQYQNNLKAVSTNGIAIEGNYNQWGLGTSFEAGYRFETTKSSWMQPYAQLSWLQVEGKEIKLSNEMTGDINAFTSLRSEVGLSAGYEFCLGGDVSSMAYITAAWLRENRDGNRTTINKLHQFVTDLSGNFGKLGIGLSSLVSEKFKLYAEAQYVKGDKVKQSFQGILGVRYSF
ncbi:pertactin family virulence factor/autotransporter [Bartonella henselae]|uniref:Pertactin family virulence factor/autotransporter n=1 Tax=Bartonella henselae TaxID=38323 RepID=X5M6P3_BARHN|nr:BafA family autotransporter [Bartonella henselae]CDO46553.1 pertactin family virulence factor/autotransporter [Bartonella henselae]